MATRLRQRPRLADLFCCQGGATRGYERAGFEVVGVDIDPQPRYCGKTFVQCDALEFIAEHGHEFDAFHASCPCQLYSKAQRIQGREHPDLIAATRAALEATGRPFVIENVEDAARHLRNPATLCGVSFGLRTYRHRLFESGGGFDLPRLVHPRHTAPLAKMGRPIGDGEFYHAVGNFSGVDLVREDMGMGWASRDGLREAIPPCYAEYVGRHMLEHIRRTDMARAA